MIDLKMIPASKYMRKLLAEFCRVGLSDASPRYSFVVRTSELEMGLATESTNTIAGGTEFSTESSQVWFLNISDEKSGSFTPGRSKGAKVDNQSCHAFILLHLLKKFKVPTFRRMWILDTPGQPSRVQVLHDLDG